MSWPDTYKDRYEALQRAVRILQSYVRTVDAQAAGSELAKDPEAAIEYGAAIGRLDELGQALDEATR